MRPSLLALVVLIFSSCPAAAPQEKNTGTITNSPQGFENQYHEFLDAYRSGDTQRVERNLEGFQLPLPWFNEKAGADHGSELAEKYLAQFKDFEYSTASRLGKCGGPSVTNVKIKPEYSVEVKIPTKPFENLPPATRITITYGPCTWMDGFVYVGGRFRFYGKGGHSFWDPRPVRLADPCGPNDGTQPNGRLIHRVEPIYPDEAKRKHVKGFVKMVVTVAKDGSVKDVEIVEGNPLLVDAARAAVMQWHYTSFMNCGEPVEMGSFEHVKFPPK